MTAREAFLDFIYQINQGKDTISYEFDTIEHKRQFSTMIESITKHNFNVNFSIASVTITNIQAYVSRSSNSNSPRRKHVSVGVGNESQLQKMRNR